jgi:hypothetical protein
MASRIGDREIQSLDRQLNRLADRFSDSRKNIEEVSLEHDVRITKGFPIFILVCVIVWIIIILFRDNYTFTAILQYLCVSFVGGFAVLGIFLFRNVDSGPLPKWLIALGAMVLCGILVLFDGTTSIIGLHAAVDTMMLAINIDLNPAVLTVLTFLMMTFIFIFTTVGVLSVIVSYLRVHLVKVFLNMHKHNKRGTRGKAESFFMVPDIIDPTDIVLEPEIDFKHFDTESSVSLFSYMVLMMLLISSYVFLNPFFLDTMNQNDMISIMFMLSMFVPSLIIPWQIMANLNARLVSEAHRDYYLWKGAKHRLMGAFLTLGAFSMLFLLSLYYGHSLVDIIVNYIMFLVPLMCTSMMYSALYTNNFRDALKVAVLSRFLEGKERLDSEE